MFLFPFSFVGLQYHFSSVFFLQNYSLYYYFFPTSSLVSDGYRDYGKVGRFAP